MKMDRRVFRGVCNAIIVAGIVVAPLSIMGVLPLWVGSALFMFTLMWVGVGAVLSERRTPHQPDRR